MDHVPTTQSERSVLRWGGLAGMLSAVLLLVVFGIVGAFVGTDPAAPEGLVARFPDIRAARIVEWNIDEGSIPEVMASLRELSPIEGAGPALGKLTGAGWRNIAVTNGSRDVAEHLLIRSGLRQHVSVVISCDDLGVSKPHPRVYNEVKRSSQGEVWLVTAHAWDVAEAMQAGIRGVWLSMTEHLYPGFLPPPDITSDDPDAAVASLLAAG